ncbi:acyl-CoA thioesterase [Pedomonas sp. V897]|uniref:acyl-CoA thioesterase n=1 Tax=Pedomonas sp. V897 TaxID=3446482 RepID=UPI003EDF44B1
MGQDRFAQVEALLRDKASFRHFTQERVRFSDTDMVGHVNNTAYAVYCESGRVDFASGLGDRLKGRGIVMARIAINMLAETFFPGTVEVGTGVLRVGRTSYTLGQGLFVGDTCVATAEGVVVVIDKESRKPVPVPDEVRAFLASYRLPGCTDD